MSIRLNAIGDYLTRTTNLLDYNKDYTVIIRFKLPTTLVETWPVLFSANEVAGDGTNNYDYFGFNSDASRLRCGVKNSVSSLIEIDGTTPLVRHRWYHAVLVRRGNTLLQYLDGRIENSCTLDISTRTLAVGRNSIGKFYDRYSQYSGSLSNFKSFTRALSSQDVLQDYYNNDYIVGIKDDLSLSATNYLRDNRTGLLWAQVGNIIREPDLVFGKVDIKSLFTTILYTTPKASRAEIISAIPITWPANTTNPPAQTIEIPPETTAVYVFWTMWNNSLNSGISSITLNGTTPNSISDLKVNGTLSTVGVAAWYNPPTGTRTIDLAWTDTPSEGPVCTIAFVKGGNVSAWRNIELRQGDSTTQLSTTHTTESNDLLLRFEQRYRDTPDNFPPLENSWTSLVTSTNDDELSRFSYRYADSTSVTANAQNEYFSTLAVISIPKLWVTLGAAASCSAKASSASTAIRTCVAVSSTSPRSVTSEVTIRANTATSKITANAQVVSIKVTATLFETSAAVNPSVRILNSISKFALAASVNQVSQRTSVAFAKIAPRACAVSSSSRTNSVVAKVGVASFVLRASPRVTGVMAKVALAALVLRASLRVAGVEAKVATNAQSVSVRSSVVGDGCKVAAGTGVFGTSVSAFNSFVSTTAKIARPISDTVKGAWVPSSGNDLAPMIDEVTLDLLDHISTTQSGDVCRMRLNMVVDPRSSAGQAVSYTGSGSFIARLKQNTTVIASWTETGLNETTVHRSLTAGECDSITDYGDLFIEFESV